MVKLNCQKCGKEFFTYEAWLRKPNRGKYCSRLCQGQTQRKFTGAIGYGTLHDWIKKNYGKANKCEMKECPAKSKTFDWALKEGCKYELKIENYLQLCRSCHKKYDYVKYKPNVRERFMARAPLEFISKS